MFWVCCILMCLSPAFVGGLRIYSVGRDLIPATNRSNIAIESVMNGVSLVLDTPSPNFVFANNSFDITAVVHQLPLEGYSTCSLISPKENNWKGDFILMLNHLNVKYFCPMDMFFDHCHQHPRCRGLILVANKFPNAFSWMARTRWFTGARAYPPSFPAVGLKGDTTEGENLLHITSEDKLAYNQLIVARIRLGDHNLYTFLLRQGWYQATQFFVAIHAAINAFLCVSRAAAFINAPEEGSSIRIPLAIMILEFLANTMRMMTFLNCVPFEGQALLPWPAYRFFIATHFPLSVGSTATLALAIFHAHQSTVQSATYKSSRTKLIAYFVIAVVTFDAANNLTVATVGQEAIDTTILLTIYTLTQIPVSIAFVRFGHLTAKMLTQVADEVNLPAEEKEKRSHFAAMVKICGITLGINTLLMMWFSSASKKSELIYLVGSQWLFASWNMAATSQILAIRKPARRVAPLRNGT